MAKDFDIEWLIREIGGQLTNDELTETLSSLIKNGYVEQFIDEKGDFIFELTDKARKKFDFLDPDEN
tara:strand:+ start:2997 stop:3197 length:201 start_codon:yes stop_codon:yes gene_type:complete